ncbi:MAG: hypothetical protein ACI4M5_01445 [Christensenellales bacterium]
MKRKQTNDEKIIEALDALDKSMRELRNFGAKFDSYIDDAFIRKDENRAKQLIRQKHSVFALADKLDQTKNNIALGAHTAKVVANLGKLPDAIAGCKGLLKQAPDFKKVGVDSKKIFGDINKTLGELDKLNESLSIATDPKPESRLDDYVGGDSELENLDWFKAERAAAEERIKNRIASERVSKAAPSDNLTGDIDYAGIIDEENRKS